MILKVCIFFFECGNIFEQIYAYFITTSICFEKLFSSSRPSRSHVLLLKPGLETCNLCLVLDCWLMGYSHNYARDVIEYII